MSENGVMNGSSGDIRTIEATAARWFARLHGQPVAPEVEAEFDAWLDQSAAHREAYMRCELTLALTRGLVSDADLMVDMQACERMAANDEADARAEEEARQRVRAQRPWWLSAAAALVLAVVTGSYFFAHRDQVDEYQTRVGEQRRVVLADRSTMTLNTDTALTVRFNDHKRRVDIRKGEAFFSVSHDKSRPFEVYAAGGMVRAVGTEFGVQVVRDRVTVSVLEGAVVVVPENQLPTDGGVIAVPPLTANMSVSYRAGGTLEPVQAADARRINAWREGKLVFESVPLLEAIAEFNRYTTHKVSLQSGEVGQRPVSGVIKIGDVDSLAFLLRESLGIRVVDQGGRLLVLDSPEASDQP